MKFENKNTTKFVGFGELVLRANFTLNAYIRKEKKIINLRFYLMELKKEKIKYKVGKRKNNLKFRAEISETEKTK